LPNDPVLDSMSGCPRTRLRYTRLPGSLPMLDALCLMPFVLAFIVSVYCLARLLSVPLGKNHMPAEAPLSERARWNLVLLVHSAAAVGIALLVLLTLILLIVYLSERSQLEERIRKLGQPVPMQPVPP
jgi:heme/copper-type cytochrome/quinol oxidase subunit 2